MNGAQMGRYIPTSAYIRIGSVRSAYHPGLGGDDGFWQIQGAVVDETGWWMAAHLRRKYRIGHKIPLEFMKI